MVASQILHVRDIFLIRLETLSTLQQMFFVLLKFQYFSSHSLLFLLWARLTAHLFHVNIQFSIRQKL